MLAMRSRLVASAAVAASFFAAGPGLRAQDSAPPPPSKQSQVPHAQKDSDAEAALQKAVAGAGNDRARLVRNLTEYVKRFPDSPRQAAVYRALVESCQQLRDNSCALEYSERLIAIRPDDSEMMMLAAGILEDQGDDASLTRAAGYVSRVLDRADKSMAGDRPARVSLADWQAQHDRIRAALYYMRAKIEKSQHDLDAATKDLDASYSIRPNALAAQVLGEIAEMKRDSARAIAQYTLAFVLPERGPAGVVNRREVRMSLGNVWREVHGNDRGLGEEILETYDRVSAPASEASPSRNRDAKDVFAFVLRRIDGTTMPLDPLRGKVTVLSFWATWCGPCRQAEPIVSEVAKDYAGNQDVAVLAVDTDEDETLVASFVAREKWRMPAVFADGLDDFLNVATLPTVIVFDRSGKVSFRVEGIDSETFSASLISAVQSALAGSR